MRLPSWFRRIWDWLGRIEEVRSRLALIGWAVVVLGSLAAPFWAIGALEIVLPAFGFVALCLLAARVITATKPKPDSSPLSVVVSSCRMGFEDRHPVNDRALVDCWIDLTVTNRGQHPKVIVAAHLDDIRIDGATPELDVDRTSKGFIGEESAYATVTQQVLMPVTLHPHQAEKLKAKFWVVIVKQRIPVPDRELWGYPQPRQITAHLRLVDNDNETKMVGPVVFPSES